LKQKSQVVTLFPSDCTSDVYRKCLTNIFN